MLLLLLAAVLLHLAGGFSLHCSRARQQARASARRVGAIKLDEASVVAELASIRAAPRCAAAFDLAEGLSTDRSLPASAWREAFRSLVTSEAFVAHGWARRPFKLREEWPWAVGSYSMADVERDVTRMPPQFVAHGVQHQGGIYNKPMGAGFSYADVSDVLDSATVVLLNAGFLVPKIAEVSLAMLEATSLMIWTNVYVSRPGLTRSTQLHTDKQDVFLIQCTGRKRWRVYSPPHPAESPELDPMGRGKGTDHLVMDQSELLIDTVMEPGQVLYIPAGYPHDTDTVHVGNEAEGAAAEPSVHLTVGVDTHLWGCSFSKLREVAAARTRASQRAGAAASAAALGGGATGQPLAFTPPPPAAVHPQPGTRAGAPLPLGFAAAPHLSALLHHAAGRAACVEREAAEAALRSAIARELGELEAELGDGARGAADRSEAPNSPSSVREAAAARMLQHHREVLSLQARMYRRAAEPRPSPTARERTEAISVLMADFDRLDECMAALDAWGRGEERPEPPAGVDARAKDSTTMSKASAGFGGGAGSAKRAGKAAKAGKGKKRK
jgi:hypothetical protein